MGYHSRCTPKRSNRVSVKTKSGSYSRQGAKTPRRNKDLVVMHFEPDTTTAAPAALIQYEQVMSDKTGFISALPRCGTISGSSGGWDDSKQDC